MATEHATEQAASSASRPGPAARRRKLWWYVRLVVWPLLLIWFGWFAYVRWTTPPAAFVDGPPALEQQRDPFSDLGTAISTLPPYPPTAANPQRAWIQVSWLPDALRGPWDPAARQEQADAVKHLSSPRVSKGLDRVVEACDELRAMGPNRPRCDQSGTGCTLFMRGFGFGIESVINPLAIRARLHHTGQQDPAGALPDLRAALFLYALALEAEPRRYYHDAGDSSVALLELLYMARELDLPPTFASEMIHFFSDELPFSLSAALASQGLQATDIQGFLDEHYTDDGHGSGWLVLSTVDTSFFGMTGVRPTRRSGFWNLFSPLFNDRGTVTAKLTGLDSQLRDLDQLDYVGVCEALRRQSGMHARLTFLDGPLVDAVCSFDPLTLDHLFAAVMWRRATVVMLALSAYKHDHGRYPAQLGELVPDYLAELPDDLQAAAPFVYERGRLDTYRLRPAKPIPSGFVLRARQHTPPRVGEYSVSRPAADE